MMQLLFSWHSDKKYHYDGIKTVLESPRPSASYTGGQFPWRRCTFTIQLCQSHYALHISIPHPLGHVQTTPLCPLTLGLAMNLSQCAVCRPDVLTSLQSGTLHGTFSLVLCQGNYMFRVAWKPQKRMTDMWNRVTQMSLYTKYRFIVS